MGGRLAFLGEVGGQNNLCHDTIRGSREQTVQTNLTRTYAIQRTQSAHQDKIEPSEHERLLNYLLIGGRFNHTKLGSVAFTRTTKVTPILLGKAIALVTVPHRSNRIGQRPREQTSALKVVLEQMPGKPLCGLWTHAWQTTQSIHQSFQNHWLTVEIHEQFACALIRMEA
jgi:hypothetical protein